MSTATPQTLEWLHRLDDPLGHRLESSVPMERKPALSPFGKAALHHAQRGWSVIPCAARGKKPLTEHGLKDATTDPQKIRAWWKRWPDANIGSPMGGNRIAIDMDGPEADAAMMELEREHGALPETLQAKTGRGRHLYFNPNGAKVKSSAGVLGSHVDIRGDGSYLILPPSVHASGTHYEWVNDVSIAPLPEAWCKFLSSPERPKANTQPDGEKIPQGRRNQHLTSLAGSMRRPGMSPAAIEAALLKENVERCEPPLSEREVKAVAASVSRYDPEKPGPQLSGQKVSLAKIRTFASINPEPLRWLWSGRFALGKMTLLVGDPGLGKSLLTVDIAARGSTGASFPDGAPCEQGDVIFLSAEDDAADTIRPRLDAAGADVSRVHWLEAVRNIAADGKSVESTFNLGRDIEALEDALRQTNARLIVIDPISAYLGGTDSHANADVRGLLAPFSALAMKYKAAIIAVTHLRKSAGAAIYRTMGSLAFAAAARAVWGVVADPDDKARRLFIPVKQNLAPDGGGLAYRVEAPNDVARIAWEPGAVAADANSLMGGFENREDHSERREAAEWLQDFLAHGPQPVPEIQRQSRQAGLTWITIRRAADTLGIVKRKSGFGAGWQWSLSEDAHPGHSEVSTFDNCTENKEDNSASAPEDAHLSNAEHLYPASTIEEGQI